MSKSPGTASARPFRIDPFIVGLLIAAALGMVLPARGPAATVVDILKNASITLLFFLQGVRLERAAVIQGMIQWRLQVLTLASTFILFPLLGFAAFVAFPDFLSDSLWLGVLFLCALPSTVQSSIAFTSIAKGNVPAAVCAATASNLLGIFITPALVALLLNRHSDIAPLSQVQAIVVQLLVPFIVGQIASRWLRPWAKRNSAVLSYTDRGSILLVVYAAFSAAVIAGAWSALKPIELLRILLISVVLLAIVLLATCYSSRALKFPKADEIVVVFCGSKKSLATGVPMANILFPATMVGLAILPVMVFHQIQLMICAFLARRYAERAEMETATRPA
jgi:sodium/bile acid cotransporter 7